MGALAKFKDLAINWDMGPADAVAVHLEWGNTGYSGRYGNPEPESFYFSIDTWQEPYLVRLQKMTKDGPETLQELDLPREYWSCCDYTKGVHSLPPEVKEWLKTLF
jgi:hypothetical protein